MTYGCYNRPPLAENIVRHGICGDTGNPIISVIPDKMSRDCQYQKTDIYNDPGCKGCIHKEKKNEPISHHPV